jgi:hypothetical protein
MVKISLNGKKIHLCHENYDKMTKHFSFHHHNHAISKLEPLFIMFIYFQQTYYQIMFGLISYIYSFLQKHGFYTINIMFKMTIYSIFIIH